MAIHQVDVKVLQIKDHHELVIYNMDSKLLAVKCELTDIMWLCEARH